MTLDGMMPGEQMLFQTKPHWSTLIGAWLFIAISFPFPVLFVVSVPVLVYSWLKRRTTSFVVTNRRVLAQSGILLKDIVDIPLARVESVVVGNSNGKQGNVRISGSGGTDAQIKSVNDPNGFRNAIYAALEAAPQRRIASGA